MKPKPPILVTYLKDVGSQVDNQPPTGIKGEVIFSFQPSAAGGNNPLYRSQIRAGVNATTDYYGISFTDLSVTPFGASFMIENSFTKQTTTSWRREVAPSAVPSIPASSFTSSQRSGIINQAKAQAISAARARMMDLAGPTALAEASKTLKMIRGAGKTLLEETIRFARGQRRRVFRNQKDILDSYLAWTYGVAPLISDIEGGARHLKSLGNVRRGDFRAQAEIKISTVTVTSYAASPFTVVTNRTVEEEFSCRIAGKLRGSIVNPPNLNPIIANLGFDQWTEVKMMAWEILPWSFVFDYFANVNALLSSEYISESHVQYAYMTTREVTKIRADSMPRMTHSYPPAVKLLQVISTPGKTTAARHVVNRTKGVGPPAFTLRVPSSKALLNISVLAAVRLGR